MVLQLMSQQKNLKDNLLVQEKILKNTKPFQFQQKKVTRIGKKGEEITKTIYYKLKVKRVGLDTKIKNAVWNTQMLKMI